MTNFRPHPHEADGSSAAMCDCLHLMQEPMAKAWKAVIKSTMQGDAACARTSHKLLERKLTCCSSWLMHMKDIVCRRTCCRS